MEVQIDKVDPTLEDYKKAIHHQYSFRNDWVQLINNCETKEDLSEVLAEAIIQHEKKEDSKSDEHENCELCETKTHIDSMRMDDEGCWICYECINSNV